MNTAPDSRQAHAIAERMDHTNSQQATRPQEQERGIRPKQRCVSQLEQRPQERGPDGHLSVRDPKLIEVVYVR